MHHIGALASVVLGRRDKMRMRIIIITQSACLAMLHCTIVVRQPWWCWGAAAYVSKY